jgi:aldose 1-epimerase
MIELRAGEARVLIDPERGGRVAKWSIGNRELLVGPASPDDRSIRWGCFLMAPWPGRLAGGRFEWAGATVQLPRTHGRHAIHGLLWDRPWEVQSAGPRIAELAIDAPAGAWPVAWRVRQRISLEPDRLTLAAELEAGGPMPAALGWHPWFRRDGAVGLRVDADAVLATRAMLPTGRTEPVAGRTDLRRGPPLGRRRLDHAYVDARTPASVRWDDLELEIAFDPAPATVVVHTPPGRFCVEPQTAWPNALTMPDSDRVRAGVRLLGPGEVLRAAVAMPWRFLPGRAYTHRGY